MIAPFLKRIEFLTPAGVTEHIIIEYYPEWGHNCELSISNHRQGETYASIGREQLRELINALCRVEEEIDTFIHMNQPC